MCTFFEQVIIATYEGVHGEKPGRTDSGDVHPVNAQNKTLISSLYLYLKFQKMMHLLGGHTLRLCTQRQKYAHQVQGAPF